MAADGPPPRDMFDSLPPARASSSSMQTAAKAAIEDWEPILPAPVPAPEKLPRVGGVAPASVWEYRDPAGGLLFLMARYDLPCTGKAIRPYTCCRGPRGEVEWRSKSVSAPRPLYGLDRLAARPDAPVLLVEGEKAADAAAALFPDLVAMTWAGGASAVAHAECSPLRGRRCAIWPDADDPGRKAADDLAKRLRVVGVAGLGVVDVPADWPKAWDVADTPPPGVSATDLRGLLDAALADVSTVQPPGFFLTADGLFWRSPGDPHAAAVLVCGWLRAIARVCDADGGGWGLLLEWRDGEGRRHEWVMRRSLLAGDGVTVRETLMARGLHIGASRTAREKLSEFLGSVAPPTLAMSVSRIGWHGAGAGRFFMLPDGPMHGQAVERAVLQVERPDAMPVLHRAGTLEGWRADVGALAVGNSRLAFAICCGFAAPLLALADGEAGGFHLRGSSSLGKSTALILAASVWSGGGLQRGLRSWRSTSNALEAVAALHCDLLLCLDEIGEAAPDAVSESAYMLPNGAGKSRAGRDGGAQRSAEWRILFLSSGEVGLADRLSETRGGARRVREGQELRVLDIPADAGAGLGLFETLPPGCPDAGLFAQRLAAAAAAQHGTAGRAWLVRLADDPDGMGLAAREIASAWVADHVPADASGQVRRAAGRFALVAAAGALATLAGLLPWPAGEAERAVAACFRAWLGSREAGLGSGEDLQALVAVRSFLEMHGEARFTPIIRQAGGEEAAPDRATTNRAGFRVRDAERAWTYWVLPGAWKEICRGLDPTSVARALRWAGHLEAGDGKNLAATKRLPGMGKGRVYVVLPSIFHA